VYANRIPGTNRATDSNLNDPDFIRLLTVSTRLLSPNKSARISAPGRDLVDDGEKKRTGPEHSPQLDFLYVVPRRLEDRIRVLSARAVSITDPQELNEVNEQLRTLLREHMDRLRRMFASHSVPAERRKSRLEIPI